MNDYKELIAALKAAANRNSNSLYTRDACSEAAYVIEQLVKERDALEFRLELEMLNVKSTFKERDALVADLNMAVNGQETYPCQYCANAAMGCGSRQVNGCPDWEWRGVQNE